VARFRAGLCDQSDHGVESDLFNGRPIKAMQVHRVVQQSSMLCELS